MGDNDNADGLLCFVCCECMELLIHSQTVTVEVDNTLWRLCDYLYKFGLNFN